MKEPSYSPKPCNLLIVSCECCTLKVQRGNVRTLDSFSLFKGAFLTSPMLDTTAATNLGDDGAVLLAKALESPNCKLVTLNLRGKLFHRLWKQFFVLQFSAA